MQSILKPGQTINSSLGHEYIIKNFIGSGGQGEVYQASGKGRDWAVKWYFSHQATEEQRKILEKLVADGAPNKNFLWPLELLSVQSIKGYGYIMPLREKRFKNIVDLMKSRIDPSFYTLTTAAYHLVDSYYQLHMRGLCYRDISFGNVFFDPNTGEVLICDNDNVSTNNINIKSSVLGTPRFMAPEIVRGESMPSTDTDLFSLAILLFYFFHISHPLEGKKESAIHSFDAPAMKKIYGDEPIFIFDPNNISNRPDPAVHKNAEIYWKIYPNFFKEFFIRSFTTGLLDPQHGRVRETEWKTGLLKLRNSIISCPNCKSENFYNLQPSGTNSTTTNCWNCNTLLSCDYKITIENNVILLNKGSKLVKAHIDTSSFNIDEIAGEISVHPSDPRILGIKNVTTKKWLATKPDNSLIEVEPGRNIKISDGLKIDFGYAKGIIERVI